MHLPVRQKLYAAGAGLVMLGGLGFVGLQWLRPVAPLSVEPLKGTPPKIGAGPASPDADPNIDPAPKPQNSQEVVVALAGAVRRGGLYRLPPDARVDDAIRAAGGAAADADLDAINLAAKAVDGDQIYVPRRKAAEPAKAEETAKVAGRYRGGGTRRAYVARPIEPPMPPTLGGSLASEPIPGEPVSRGSGGNASAGGPLRLAKAKAAGPVSLNAGSEADLETLPGVGPATAQKILEYRQSHGGFASIEEIQNVRGIGAKKFEKMRPFLTL